MDNTFVPNQLSICQPIEQAEEEQLDAEMQSYYDLLAADEREILKKLDYYCFDQSGCRMLQQMIQD